MLECDSLHIDMRTWETPSFVIGNLRDLCLDYPQGLGAHCDGPEIVLRLPFNPLYFNIRIHGGGGIATLCRQFCRCADVAPDLPAIGEAAVNHGGAAECALDEVNDGVAVPSPVHSQPIQPSVTARCSSDDDHHDDGRSGGGGERSMKYASHYQCDGGFYGHPNSVDCKAAIQQLPDWGVAEIIYREFYETGDPPDYSHTVFVEYGQTMDDRVSFSFGDSVKAPLMLTHGTCTVAILLPDNPQGAVIVRSKALIAVTEALESKCVSKLGNGGKFDHVYDTGAETDCWIPNVFIFGTKSLMESWLDLLVKSRRLTLQGKTADAESSGKTSGSVGGGGTDSVHPKGSEHEACSGSCMNPTDCDTKSNCVCASDKPLPLSSTWGQHACMYVAGAALALAQSKAVKPHGRCRGRCLNEGIDDDKGNSNKTNLTTAMIPSSSSYFNITNSSLPALTPTNLTLNHGLTCPCNCTYVAAACCLSHTVWETQTPDQGAIKMVPLPMNASVRCDRETGLWRDVASAVPLNSSSTPTGRGEGNGEVGGG